MKFVSQFGGSLLASSTLTLFCCLGVCLAAAPQAAQAQSRYVGPNCEGEPPAGVLDSAPFESPALRELWRARQALLAWEATPEVSALLAELDRNRLAAQVYFDSLNMVYLYHRDPKLQGQEPANRTFILGNVRNFQQNRTAPEAWIQTATQIMEADREQRIRKFVLASHAASADMDRAPLRLPGRRPALEELTGLASKAHMIWTVGCSTPIRIFNQSTNPPLPTGFLFNTTGDSPEKPVFDNEASRILVKIHNDRSEGLVDSMALLIGEPLLVKTLQWGGLYAFIRRTIDAQEPALLAEIGRMTDAQLNDLRAKQREGVVSNQPTYAALNRPAIDRAMLTRRVALRGLATEPSPLPLKEKARLNLPPTEAELLSLLTDLTMAYTVGLNRKFEFVRVSSDTFEDYSTSELLGRRKTGESKVNMLDPRCQPVAKGQRCTFITNIYLSRNGLFGINHAKALPAHEQTVVISWGPDGLVSEDLRRNISGWVRTPGGSGGGSGGGSVDDGRDTMRQAGEERSAEREERQQQAQQRWQQDQEERRQRNRSCGPAPNICN